MTSIAWRDGILAADSQVSNGDLRRGVDRKVWFRQFAGVNVYFGFSGDAVVGQKFTDLLTLSEDVDQFLTLWEAYEGRKGAENRFEGFIIWDQKDPTFGQKCWLFYHDFPMCQHYFKDYIAFGSGRDLAMGAMAMGATAIDGVNVAVKYDNGSGLPVQWVNRDGIFCVV